jgi:hypothetical protein
MRLPAQVLALMVGVALLVVASSPVQAQATLDVQIASGQSTFRVGERISPRLTFRSPNDTQYTIAPYGNGSRGDEFDTEHFDVSSATRDSVGRRSASPPYRVVLPNAARPNGVGFPRQEVYSIGQYQTMSRELLAAKIKQYPRGTRFLLSDPWAATEDQRKLEMEIQTLFARSGMSLEKPDH